MNIAILGAGHIAEKISEAILGLDKNYHPYAVASRDKVKAQIFAKKWNFDKAYGSYEEMLSDNSIDLVYIATPHSHHYKHALMCINAGKNILVEKAFTANANQAEEVLTLASKKGIMTAEALWTRYMPSRKIINDLVQSNIIGETVSLTANICYPIENKERLRAPSLAGGALLDIGIYPLNFASMIFGNDIENITGECIKLDTGVDAQESITIKYKDGKLASLFCSIRAAGDRSGVIYGSKGYIDIQNINNPEVIHVYNCDHKMIEEIYPPKQINGYEYELIACYEAIKNLKTECIEMSHSEIIEIMRQMDKLRNDWNIIYPFEQ